MEKIFSRQIEICTFLENAVVRYFTILTIMTAMLKLCSFDLNISYLKNLNVGNYLLNLSTFKSAGMGQYL